MVSGKIVRIKKQVTDEGDRYVILLIDSQGAVAWSSPELAKDQAIRDLLEIGLPSHKIPAKFDQAESAASAVKDSAA